MRALLFFCLISPLLFSSCNHDRIDPTELTGEWELEVSINGLSGQATRLPENNGSVLRFGKQTYEMYDEHKLVKSGTYYVKIDTIYALGHLGDRIIYDGVEKNVMSTYFVLSNKRLMISVDASDAPSSIYRKIRN